MNVTYTVPLQDNGIFNNVPSVGQLLSILSDPQTFATNFYASNTFFYLQLFSFAISVAFLMGIILLMMRIIERTKKTRKDSALRRIKLEKTKSKRWDIVEGYISSSNPAEWKLAIMEADSMLEELVKKLGYPGSTLGEMMKQIKPADFVTINDAWEAHKVRNYIAHQGSTFILTKHQANRAIKLYEKVFNEFEFI